MKNATIQQELDEIAAHLGKPASLQLAGDFAEVQNRTWQRRWSLLTELKAARHLRLSIGISPSGVAQSL
jgi:hypothetical protein